MSEVKNDELLALETELDRRSIAMEQWKKVVNWAISTTKKVWEAVKKAFNDFVDTYILTPTSNYKHYHLFKHAKKYRTRKEYRRRPWREMIFNMTRGAFIRRTQQRRQL